MGEKLVSGLLVCTILLTCVLFAGCSDQSSSSTAVPTTTAPLAKYVAGDIIGKSASTGQFATIILSYDSKRDVYNKALVYKNSDGSWGHRVNTQNDTMERDLVEKTYPVKISHVDVSSVLVVVPTAPSTIPTTLGSAPQITNISPPTGATGTTETVVVTGRNFQNGATMKLLRGGSPTILAVAVSTTGSTITGTFNLDKAVDGSYTVIVTNPDGQAASLSNGFTVGEASPIIVGVMPNSGSPADNLGITITGQNFGDVAKVTFAMGSTTIDPIYISNLQTIEGDKITFNLELPNTTPLGDYDVSVLNVEDQTTGTWIQKFHVVNATSS